MNATNRDHDGWRPKCLAIGVLAALSVCFQLAGALETRSPPNGTEPAPDATFDGSINLGAILQHQQALIGQCRQLEARKFQQLRQLVEFSRDNERVHLSSPLAIRLPAVCLFLNGPPELDQERDGAGQEASNSLRTDLVNWIVDPQELIASSQGSDKDNGTIHERAERQAASNKFKREVGQRGERWREFNNIESNWLFEDYPLDVHSASEFGPANWRVGDNEADELRDVHRKIDRLLEDERFKQALEKDRARIDPHLSPVILVPGLAGSRLQARVSKQHRVNIICSKQTDWRDMWMSLRSFLPIAIDCWIDNARLEYDPQSGFAREPPGVE